MKSRVLKVLAFVVALFLADGLVFFSALHLSTFFKPEEWSLAQKLAPQQGLILGTSHAEEGLIPSIIQNELGGSWHNLGQARRNLNFNQYWTKALIDHGQRPQTVVLVVTYHDWNEQSHPYILYPLADPARRFDVALDLAQQRYWLNPRTWFLCDQYSSTLRMMLARSLSWLKNRQPTIAWKARGDGGYRQNYGHLKAQKEPESFAKYPWNVLEPNRLAFFSIIQQWQAIGTKVIVIDVPEYLGSRLSHAEYERAWAMVEKECRELKVVCRSFSLPEDAFLSDETNFRDGGWGYPNSHLSHKGATLFSQKLARWLAELRENKSSAE